MSELFLSFEKDFCNHLNHIKVEMQAFDNQKDNLALNQIERDITEAEKCVKFM